MAPSSKRSTTDRPKSYPREGEKCIKYWSLGFTGMKQRFTSCPAAVIVCTDPTVSSTQPSFCFDPRVTPWPIAEAWVAPGEEAEPDSSVEEVDTTLDPNLTDELEQVLLNGDPVHSGK
ncbi:hypothetical protein FRC10_002343, partial [Ceratobasidium sp. 414]